MSDATTAAVILIISVGVVISYPSLMYPPIRRATNRIIRALGWPFRSLWRECQRITGGIRERRELRQEIPELVQFAQDRAAELVEATGRMWLETQLYIHKPQNMIGDADRDHETLTERQRALLAKSYGQPVYKDEWFQRHESMFPRPSFERWWELDMWFTWVVWKVLAAIFIATYALPRRIPSYRVRSRQWLRRLRDEWLWLLEEQARLLDVMTKLPERTMVYDRLEAAKELKRQQRETEDELLRPLKTAEIALESAKAHLRMLRMRPQHTPTKGSAVLWVDDAIKDWQARVDRIERARSKDSNPEALIEAIHSLERDMAMAGIHAAKVIWIERRAQQIWKMHRILKKRYDGLRLPDTELEAITTAVRKVVSPQWAEGRWDELAGTLDRVLVSIQNYERLVLSCVWQLHAGSFDQLVQRVFHPERPVRDTDMRINPQADESMKKAAAAGPAKQSPYVEQVLEHAQKNHSRVAQGS